MSIFEYLKVPDIILSLFLHKYWTGLILLASTVFTNSCSIFATAILNMEVDDLLN